MLVITGTDTVDRSYGYQLKRRLHLYNIIVLYLNQILYFLFYFLQCSQVITIYGLEFTGYCHIWSGVHRLLPYMVWSSQAIAIYGLEFTGYCRIWSGVHKLLPYLVWSSQAIAIYGLEFTGYCHIWSGVHRLLPYTVWILGVAHRRYLVSCRSTYGIY